MTEVSGTYSAGRGSSPSSEEVAVEEVASSQSSSWSPSRLTGKYGFCCDCRSGSLGVFPGSDQATKGLLGTNADGRRVSHCDVACPDSGLLRKAAVPWSGLWVVELSKAM